MGLVDDYEVIVRVNNFKLLHGTGYRTDVFYSFFGTSVKKSPGDLAETGVKLCMCKCPNAHAIKSNWHIIRGKRSGVDFRYIYQRRAGWWFCDTYIPEVPDFLAKFNLLGQRVPTTGFAAILDVLACNPREVFLTGFDFFRSGLHNVNEPWRAKNTDDPIGHAPGRELQWLRDNMKHHPIVPDGALATALAAF